MNKKLMKEYKRFLEGKPDRYTKFENSGLGKKMKVHLPTVFWAIMKRRPNGFDFSFMPTWNQECPWKPVDDKEEIKGDPKVLDLKYTKDQVEEFAHKYDNSVAMKDHINLLAITAFLDKKFPEWRKES